MMERLEMSVVHCSSEEPHFPAKEMVRQGPGVPRGWHSAPNCDYPQAIGLRFLIGEVHLSRLQFVANDSRVPSRVEVHTASADSGPNFIDGEPVPFHSAVFRSVGYFHFLPNKDGAFKSGQMKVISIDESVLYVKLLIFEPHFHPCNPFNQVGLTSAVSLGNVKRICLNRNGLLSAIAAGDGTTIDDHTSLLSFFRGGAYRDTTTDAQVIEKIQEMENSKLKMISMEDFESARRIRDQLDELQSLGVFLHDFEHRKRKAIAEENYGEAQRLKHIIQRVRAYVGSLKPAMPYQRIDLKAMMDASLLNPASSLAQPINDSSLVALSPLKNGASPSSFIRKPKYLEFDEIPVGREGGGGEETKSPQRSASEAPLKEGPLLLSELSEDERPLANLIRNHLPNGSSDSWHPERVSEDRASTITGWKKMMEVFGLYICCCLFAKRFQFREAALAYFTSLIHSGEGDQSKRSLLPLSQKLSKPGADVQLALLYVLATPGLALSDTVPAILFHAAEICQFLAGAAPKKAVRDALTRSLVRQICKHLVSRLGDSNPRVRQVVDTTVDVMASSEIAGFEVVSDVTMELKPKYARHAEECCKLLEKALIQAKPTPPCLSNPSTVVKRFLRSMTSHANQAVRDASLGVISEYVLKFGSGSQECAPLLATLKEQQVTAVQKLVERKAKDPNRLMTSVENRRADSDDDGPPTIRTPPLRVKRPQIPHSSAGEKHAPNTGNIDNNAFTPRPRRTVAETSAANPKLSEVFIFRSDSQPRRRQAGSPDRVDLRISNETESGVESLDPPAKPSVLRSKLHGALDTTKTTQVLLSEQSQPQQLLPKSPLSPSIAQPKRRTPPAPIAGRCQFCGEECEEFQKSEALLEHFFSDCPMLCICPLCRLPVEIREIHWHLAEDCQNRALVKRCPRCFECVRHDEYDAHIDQASCPPYSSTQFMCPLCHEALLADDIFWEAHILFPPYCPQNPRTTAAYDNAPAGGHSSEDEEGEEPDGET